MRNLLTISFFLLTSCCFAQIREIAMTIDDLPLVASKMNTPGNQQRATERFMKIIQALVDNKVPATGFVIAGAIEKGQWNFLEQFRKNGFMIGNHTYSHFNLNHTNVDKYITDIDRADQLLAPVMTEPKYFRYPYLAEGANKQAKQKVLDYLLTHHYTIVPVTIDSQDFRFNEQLYKIPFRARENYLTTFKNRYLAFIWAQTLKAEKRASGKPVKQIILLHANVLNSYVLGDIIAMYKKNGYTFITLSEALKNPAPEINIPVDKHDNEPADTTLQDQWLSH